jgi:hypothetical protein
MLDIPHGPEIRPRQEKTEIVFHRHDGDEEVIHHWQRTPSAAYVYEEKMYQAGHNGVDVYNLWNRRW